MLDPQPTTTTTAIAQSTEVFWGLVALLLSNIGIWIREAQKARSFKQKNGNLEQIRSDISSTKSKIDCVDRKITKVREEIVEVKTEIKAMKENCDQTVGRLSGEIKNNREKIFEMATEKPKRKRRA